MDAMRAAGRGGRAGGRRGRPRRWRPRTVPRISLAEFKKLHDQDKVLVIDTRSADSYGGGHIPGAINVPLSAWEKHLPRLKATRKPIVAYCA